MMGSRDARVDNYIEAAAAFARPILTHLREAVHRVVPDVTETIKWGMPHFVVGKHNLAGMAAFKAHASFGLWRGEELGLGRAGEKGGMGSFGRLVTIADLPPPAEPESLIACAASLPPPLRKSAPKQSRPPLVTPQDFAAALSQNPQAQRVWDGFAPSHRREYLEWIIDAKRSETRARRMAAAVADIALGRGRNWKYDRQKFTSA